VKASAPRRDFRALFEPRSVAVVGASADPSKWGGDVSARLLRGEHRRSVYLVNGRGGEILGHPAFPSLRDLPEEPELVILTMPARLLEDVIEDCVAVGAKAVVAVTAMLGEMGAEGKARERAAVERLRAAGALLVGPNCLGVADTGSELYAVAYLDVRPGSIGLISQSGGFGEELNLRFKEFNLGFSRFIAIGNQADLDTPAVLRSFVGHSTTRAVVVYLEEVRDGLEFARAAHELVSSGTPVVLLAPGRSEASARVARTHTGSLTPDSVVMDAACRAAGVLRVTTQREAVETLVALLGGPLPAGSRVGVVSDGGGPGAICADAATLAGLSVPQLTQGAQDRLRALLPANAGCTNPVDFAAATYDPEAYERVIAIVANSGEVDAIMATGVIGFWGARFPEQTDMVDKERRSLLRMAQSVRQSGIPLFCNTPESSPTVEELRAGGLPIYRDVESAAMTLARLATAKTPPGVPQLPPRGVPIGREGYWEARRAIAEAGVPLVKSCRVKSDDLAECVSAASELGYPVVLKASGLLHKSDAGGVVLDIADAKALVEAVERLRKSLDASATELAVERMVSPSQGVELIVGCRWDARFGPLLTVGMGGIFAELLADTQTVLAPVDEQAAAQLVSRLRGAPLLYGVRGRAGLDMAAAARAAAALSRFAAAHPEVAAVEVNPLLVLPEGAVGLDARLVLLDEDPSPEQADVHEEGASLDPARRRASPRDGLAGESSGGRHD
jgi:acetate---CoA ligase (ADP-forming)